ncbi:MAG: outer membrane lipoprotein chaperone LolA [Ferrovum sp.]|nr:outer membrane lipoprotein chaperone LolA [Ferrovum sp.]
MTHNKSAIIWQALAYVFIATLPSVAWSTGLDRLQSFLRNTPMGQAQFEQQSRKGQESSGEISRGLFQFSRPGKFRWEYQSPFPQTLVADGQTLWIWDPDLQQVTRKKLNQGLGSTPAALLAGDNTLEKGFDLKEGEENSGLEWVIATPKSQESGFEEIRMGFNAQTLARMELTDNFGHTIIIRFSGFDRAPHFNAETFHFVPPAGADVIQ